MIRQIMDCNGVVVKGNRVIMGTMLKGNGVIMR